MLRNSLLLLLLSTILLVSMNTTTISSPMKTRSDTSFLVKQTPPESFWIRDDVINVLSGQSNSLEDIITKNYMDDISQVLHSFKIEKEQTFHTSSSETSVATFTTTFMKRKELAAERQAAVNKILDAWELELNKNNLSTKRVREYSDAIGQLN